MAATETPRKSLGSLFGGKIVSINYNFQAGSQASTCTIVVSSPNNEYLIPELDEIVSIPPFSFQMKVMQTSIKKDSNRKTLQVELMDVMSNILDKELIIIYGEHTDLEYNLNKNPYYILKSAFLPREALPSNVFVNERVAGSPNINKFTIKNKGDGINVIGFSRVTYKDRRTHDISKDLDDYTGHYWLTYDAKKINKELCNWSNNFPERVQFTDNGINKLELKFGYCLRNLKDLLLSKGVSFDEKSLKFLEDENLMFTDTGTLRSVLTNALAKVGRSFYVDPFTQKIHVITNADVNTINSNLNEKYSNFENTEASKQLSLIKSLKGVTAEHFIAKGDISRQDIAPVEERDPRPRKQVFFKIDPDLYVKKIYTRDEKELFKRVAAIVNEISDNNVLDKYIFSIPFINNFQTPSWGDLYGDKEFSFKEGKHVRTAKQGDWLDELKESKNFDFNGFDIETAETALTIRDQVGDKNAKSASEHGYLDNVRNLSQFFAGIYISNPMTEKTASKRDYSNATFSGNKEHTYEIIVKKGSERLKDVPELSFLFSLMKYGKDKGALKKLDPSSLTIEDLSEDAYLSKTGSKDENEFDKFFGKNLNSTPIQSEDGQEAGENTGEKHFAIAIRDVFFGQKVADLDPLAIINKNLFEYDNGDILAVVLSKSGKSEINELVKAARSAYKQGADKRRVTTKNKLTVRYLPVQDEDEEQEQDEERPFEEPSLYALRHLPSKVKKFSQRNLGKFTGGYSEVGLFIENNTDINPQFEGPLISTNIEYFRPPKREDFSISDGVDSVSVSVSNSGVTTSVKYSSRKFAKIDNSIATDIGTQFFAKDFRNAFSKNKQGA